MFTGVFKGGYKLWALILIILNIPIYKWLFKKFFPSSGEFSEALNYYFTPDIFSLFKGNYTKDVLAEFKLGAFVFCCIILTALEYGVIKFVYNLF